MDVMFYEVFREEEEALRRHLPASVDAGYTFRTIQAEGHKTPPAGLISVRTQSQIPADWGGKISGILARSTGFEHLSVFRGRCGIEIPCGYLPLYCARSVAEHAVTMILALLKNLKKQQNHMRTFDRDGLTGSECAGRKILIAGVGNIGQEAAAIARALGMEVRGFDLVKRLDWLEYRTLEDGVRGAEVIVCALPLTPRTAGLFNDAVLREARRGFIFVNIARGEIAPVRDLKRLLDEGWLGGLGLDVYEDEGDFAEYLRSGKGPLTGTLRDYLAFRDDERVLLTPHNAFNTREALERKALQSSESVVQFLKDRTFPFPVPSGWQGEFGPGISPGP